jgi:hypothetical protein
MIDRRINPYIHCYTALSVAIQSVDNGAKKVSVSESVSITRSSVEVSHSIIPVHADGEVHGERSKTTVLNLRLMMCVVLRTRQIESQVHWSVGGHSPLRNKALNLILSMLASLTSKHCENDPTALGDANKMTSIILGSAARFCIAFKTLGQSDPHSTSSINGILAYRDLPMFFPSLKAGLD